MGSNQDVDESALENMPVDKDLPLNPVVPEIQAQIDGQNPEGPNTYFRQQFAEILLSYESP